MSSKPILYEYYLSSPARAVKMLALAIDLELQLKPIDLLKQEQHTEEFLNMNPTHTIPVLDDNGTHIWDSHAIMIYLVEKYAKNYSLYPKDIVERAKVNQLLFFDVSACSKFSSIVVPMVFKGAKGITEDQIETLKASYESVERILKGKHYLTGNDVTIADISLLTTLTAENLIAPIDAELYPNITAWIERMEGLSFIQPNIEARKEQSEFLKKYI